MKQKDIPATNIFLNAHRNFAIWKIAQGDLPQGVIEMECDFFGQCQICPARKNLDVVVFHFAGPAIWDVNSKTSEDVIGIKNKS